jgi:hypothetical protein
MGLPWHEAFFEPSGPNALLDDCDGWQDSPVAGGHEVCITALEDVVRDDTGTGLDYARTILRVQNSWSATWADQGCFRMSLDVYRALRDQTDLVQPRLDASR